MKLRLQLALVTTVCSSLIQFAARAADEPASTNVLDRVSYALGINIGTFIKRSGFDVNETELARGIHEVLAGSSTMTDMQARQVVMGYQQQKAHEQAEKNVKEGAAFLAENKTKDGVKVHLVTLSDGKTTAELQYKVLKDGTGAIPQPHDTVTVSYRGTLIDGKEFDSTAKHGGQPSKFVVGGIIRGWSEALQMMKVGSKWDIYMPATLAYGDHGAPGIEPGSVLIFEVELLNTESPQPPKPVTSDIIRVPSADEMKAGAKIEVIKSADAEKKAAAPANPPAPGN
jgi:FKBP-type peptidyl-prolyl cis-trans isomerase FklB